MLADGSVAPALSAADVLQRIPALTGVVVQFTSAHFGPAIGLSAFAAMWRAMATLYDPVDVPSALADVLWWTALALVILTGLLYCARSLVAPEGCWADIRNNRVANFFFAPVLCGVALVISAPSYFASHAFFLTFFVLLFVYQMVLALLLYGEWLFGSPYSLRKVHPLYFMAVIGFFLLSRLAIFADVLEAAYFCFAVGVLFWLQVFTTLFTSLSAVLSLQAERPQLTVFLFIAPPAAALLAWKAIWEFENAAGSPVSLTVGRVFIHIDFFLYLLLARLFPRFAQARFNVGAWASVFPLSTAATAAVSFAHFKGETFWWVLATGMVSVATVATVLVAALTIRAVVQGTLPASPESLSLYWKFHWDSIPAHPDDFPAPSSANRRRIGNAVASPV